MKYALKFYRQCPIIKDIDEVIIKYDKKDPELIAFVQNPKYENKRIIVNISVLNENIENNLDIFIASFEKNNNIAFLCSKEQEYKELKEKEIPFFFKEPAGTTDELVGQINEGVSDIYITNELGFCLKDLHDAYKDIVNIRIIPNLAQSGSNLYNNGGIKSFFIRPEDMELYKEYVDIIEFAGPVQQQPLFYKIYESKGYWNDELDIIIFGLDTDLNTSTMIPSFGQTRLNCHKRCAFNKCHICDHARLMQDILKENDLVILKKKNDN